MFSLSGFIPFGYFFLGLCIVVNLARVLIASLVRLFQNFSGTETLPFGLLNRIYIPSFADRRISIDARGAVLYFKRIALSVL